MTVPVYIAEASPPHLRGQLVTVNTLFISAGQLTASLFDATFSYLPHDGWRWDTHAHTHTHIHTHTHTHTHTDTETDTETERERRYANT